MKLSFSALFMVASVSSAFAVTLEIDSLAGMSNSPGSSIPLANRLSNERLSQGVLVASLGGYAAVVAETGFTGTGWKQNDPTVKAALGGSTSSDTLDYSSPITFTFVNPADSLEKWTTNSFSLYSDWWGDGSGISLAAYDVDGGLIGSVAGNEHNGQQLMGTQFSIGAIGIHKVVVQGSGTTAFSNIEFGEPVPEPATMLVLGLGALAAARRKRA